MPPTVAALPRLRRTTTFASVRRAAPAPAVIASLASLRRSRPPAPVRPRVPRGIGHAHTDRCARLTLRPGRPSPPPPPHI